MFLLVLAYPGCPGSKPVKRSLLLLLYWLTWVVPDKGLLNGCVCYVLASSTYSLCCSVFVLYLVFLIPYQEIGYEGLHSSMTYFVLSGTQNVNL